MIQPLKIGRSNHGTATSRECFYVFSYSSSLRGTGLRPLRSHFLVIKTMNIAYARFSAGGEEARMFGKKSRREGGTIARCCFADGIFIPSTPFTLY